jgi:hypothetical protein
MEEQSVTCPHCGGEFVVEPSAAALDQVVEHQDEQISTARIRRIAAARRASYRIRSYCIIAAVIALVTAAHLIWIGGMAPIALAAAAGTVGIHLLTRARLITRQLRAGRTGESASFDPPS